jgi:cytochrome c oxidase assembly factor CtaG
VTTTITSCLLFDTKTLVLIATTLFLVMISANGQLLRHLEFDLGTHMIVEHSLFFSFGYVTLLLCEGILRNLVNMSRQRSSSNMTRGSISIQAILFTWTRLVKSVYTIASNGLFLIICAFTLVAFWHIPSIFDFSSYSESIHVSQHFSFIVVGALFFLSLRQIGQSLILFLIISSVGMMLISGMGLAIANERVYFPYTVSSHNAAGEYMLGLSIAMGIIVLPAYLIRRTLFHVGKLDGNSGQAN